MAIRWQNPSDLGPKSYVCAFCGRHTGPNAGFTGEWYFGGESQRVFIYICSFCHSPSYFSRRDEQIPAPKPGREIAHVPDQINELYQEARQCFGANAPNATVMVSRKILMNVAVNLGADENQSFLAYVDWLVDSGHIPPQGRKWVDRIRGVGNEANHEIPHISAKDAARVLQFTEGLLTVVYEFPGAAEDPEESPE
jgi:hypothetical protein